MGLTEIIFLLTALIMPVVMGSLALHCFLPNNLQARWQIVWGYGALLGMMGVTALLRIQDRWGRPLDAHEVSLAIGLIVIGSLALARYRGRHLTALVSGNTSASSFGSTPAKILYYLLLTLIIVRLISLGFEVFWRPLFPWDATMHWATKARVWFEHRELLSFIDNDSWLRSVDYHEYTDRHPHYPRSAPLLQVWMALSIGRWDESLINLPWLTCLMAMGLALYGQLRAVQVTPIIAMSFSYLLMSMPLLNIHVALAGYADIFLGASYCGALMALHNWSVTRDKSQVLLILLCAASCYGLKNEGAIWPLTLIPAVAVVLMARREAAKLVVLLGLLGIFSWLIIPKDWMVAGTRLDHLEPIFNPEALVSIAKSALIHDSWHLFFYVLGALVLAGIILPDALSRKFLPLGAALASAGILFLFLFLFTGFAKGATNYTAVGRLTIQLIPGLTFLTALLYQELVNRSERLTHPTSE